MAPPTPDRVRCVAPGCANTIQPATAARTGGYCGPCAGKRDRAAWEAHVRANRRDLDRYAGVADPVELLRLMHTPPRHDPLVNLLPAPTTFEALYLALTPGDAARLMKAAAELLPTNEDNADEIGRCLAAFTGFALEPMLEAWLDRGRVYPALMFRGAGADVRDRLLGSLRDDSPALYANHVLSALAWVGDEPVVRHLRDADARRPAWAGQSHLAPSGYARLAGWELVAGGRRELTLPACVAMHSAEEGQGRTDHVRVMRERPDACPWCGRKLVNLLEAQTDPPLDVLSHLGPWLEVVTCRVCACFGPVHGELDAQGLGRWAAANVAPEFPPSHAQHWQPGPWSTAAVRLAPRRPTHAADPFLPTTLSQFGGFPAWVQDVEYPACLRCGRTMTFLAQVDQAAFPRDEGVYYAFVCDACRTTATAYQQT